jgi:acetyltransferase-like isoleucine patch superfamily enzyme/membrane-bound acyltransferase YfiQ involved in biofilm formation
MRQPRVAWQALWSIIKGHWCKLSYPARGIRFRAGRNFRVQGKLIVRGPGRVEFGDNVLVGGRTTPWTHHPDAVITVGNNTFLNGTRFGAVQRIEVGAYCILADAQILDTDFHSVHIDRHDPAAPVRVAPVTIGENVWIAASSGVLPGTEIGRNSVVGFGAVCSGSYEQNSLILGNPAKAVKSLTTGGTAKQQSIGPAAALARPAARPAAAPARSHGGRSESLAAARSSTLLSGLNAFSGFAVLNIVLVHVLPMYFLLLRQRFGSGYWYGSLFESSTIIFNGSTLYFVLALGVLFSARLAEQGWRSFFRAHALFILLPYAVLSLIFTAFEWNVDQGFSWVGGPNLWGRWLTNTFTGQAVFSYWYLPVLLVLAALTPLFARLGRHRGTRWTLLLFALLPLVVSRTGRTVSAETIVYFAGAYCLGMWFGLAYDRNLAMLRRFQALFLVVAIASTAGLITYPDELVRMGPIYLRESLFYLQKLSLSALAIVVLQRFAAVVSPMFDSIARHAYAICLLHIVFVELLVTSFVVFWPRPEPTTAFAFGLLAALTAIAGSLVAANWLERLVSWYSRAALGT